MRVSQNILLQVFVYTMLLIIVLAAGYFVFGTIPQFFGIELNSLAINCIYIGVALLCYIPLVVHLKRKWNTCFKRKFYLIEKNLLVGVLLLTISVGVLSVSFLGSFSYIYRLLLEGTVNVMQVKFPNAELLAVWLTRLIHAVFVGAVLEELLFRGIILEHLRKVYSPKVSILASSFLFSIAHMQFDNFIGLFLFGCLFGYIYIRTNSLLLSIFSHSFLNLFLQFIELNELGICELNYMQLGIILISIMVVMKEALKHKTKKINIG